MKKILTLLAIVLLWSCNKTEVFNSGKESDDETLVDLSIQYINPTIEWVDSTVLPNAKDLVVVDSDNLTPDLYALDIEKDPVGGSFTVEISLLPIALNSGYIEKNLSNNTVHVGIETPGNPNTGSTTSEVLISEVGARIIPDSWQLAVAENNSVWFEIYNNSSGDINLSEYKIRSSSWDFTGDFRNPTLFSKTYDLPNLTIPKGEFAVLAGNHPTHGYASYDRVVYLGDATGTPYWYNEGYLEVLKEGESEDFVVFGQSTEESTTDGHWNGANAPLGNLNVGFAQFGHSIHRSNTNTDTNSASDWVVSDRQAMTPGMPNVSAADLLKDDDDADGIPDSREQPGKYYAGMNLYGWGARSNQSDYFVDIRYMADGGDGYQDSYMANEAVFDKLTKVFTDHNNEYPNSTPRILHLNAGNAFSSTIHSKYNFDGKNHEIPYSNQDFNLGVKMDEVRQLIDPMRLQIFFVGVLARKGEGSISGKGSGSDFYVAVGRNDASTTAVLAKVILHEFGHNILGFGHNGFEDRTNTDLYEPNYNSVMNYLYEFSVADIGLSGISGEGMPYYTKYSTYHNPILSNFFSINYLTQTLDQIKLDFSNGLGQPINENHVDESKGLNQYKNGVLISVPIDFNMNGVIENDVKIDLNYDGRFDTFTDSNDWENMSSLWGRVNIPRS